MVKFQLFRRISRLVLRGWRTDGFSAVRAKLVPVRAGLGRVHARLGTVRARLGTVRVRLATVLGRLGYCTCKTSACHRSVTIFRLYENSEKSK